MPVTEIAEMLGALGTLLSVMGGGVVWLARQTDKRFKAVEKKLAACEAREKLHAKREQRQSEASAKQLIVIELLWQEVMRRSRGAPSLVLGRCQKLLDDLKQTASEEHDHDRSS